jgi:rhomboid protease GluP
VDGSLDFGQFSNAELYAALRRLDRHSRPVDYENLLAELRARGLGVEQAATGSSGANAFPVRFSKRGLLARPGNSFGLAGEGTLAIGSEALRVTGRTRGILGLGRRTEELQFPIADVANVSRHGELIRLELRTSGRAPRHLTLWADDEVTAERIVASLPRRQTDEYRAAVADVRDFLQRLEQLGTNAYVTRGLIAINVVIFFAMVAAGAGLMGTNPEVHVRWGSNYGPLTASGQWWRLATSMFLHFGFIHLLFNMWVLQAYGVITERLFGSARFLLLYLGSGVMGSLTSLAWHPDMNSAGASGAIFGVFGGLVAFAINRSNGVPGSIVLSQRNSLFAFLGFNLFFGFVHPGIDNAAHIGGLVSGFALGHFLARPLDPEVRAQRGARAFVITALAYCALLAGAILLVKARIGTP